MSAFTDSSHGGSNPPYRNMWTSTTDQPGYCVVRINLETVKHGSGTAPAQ